MLFFLHRCVLNIFSEFMFIFFNLIALFTIEVHTYKYFMIFFYNRAYWIISWTGLQSWKDFIQLWLQYNTYFWEITERRNTVLEFTHLTIWKDAINLHASNYYFLAEADYGGMRLSILGPLLFFFIPIFIEETLYKMHILFYMNIGTPKEKSIWIINYKNHVKKYFNFILFCLWLIL